MSAGKFPTNYTIFFGQSSSGKSTAIKFLQQKAEGLGRKVLFLNDGEELIHLVREDQNGLFHLPLGKGNFMVTDSLMYDLSACRVFAAAMRAMNDFAEVVVEMSCGADEEKIVDLSLGRRLELMPEALSKAQLIYIACPKKLRMQNNTQREGLWHLPDVVMSRFFMEDDPLDFIKDSGHNLMVLENNGSKSNFLEQVLAYANIEGCPSGSRIEKR